MILAAAAGMSTAAHLFEDQEHLESCKYVLLPRNTKKIMSFKKNKK